MVLQQDMPCGGFGETRYILVLADSNQVAVGFRSAYIFKHFYSIEIMLNAIIRIHDNACFIPLTRWSYEAIRFLCRDQVVERGKCAVSIASLFGVGMHFVVE